MAMKNMIVKVFSAIWSGANGVRKVLHLLLLLFIFLLFFDATSEPPQLIPRHAALVIQPVGFLVEQYDGRPFDRAVAEMLGAGTPQTLVQDIVDALEFAKNDDRIDVVYFELSRLFGAGLSKLQRVGAAIEDFRSSGKTVLANADFMSQQSYYLAAFADEAYLHPDGLLFLRGYGRFQRYYKDAIDLLRIDWNIFRVGTHKSFVEPYTRMGMSDEDRETNLRLIDQLWSQYELDVVTAGAHQVTGSEELCPEAAAVSGPCRVIPQESPHLSCREIDLELGRVVLEGLLQRRRHVAGETLHGLCPPGRERRSGIG